MPLTRFEVSDFRNLKSLSVVLEPGLNLFIGPNGAGKTSLLEAIYFLLLGRSFRSYQTSRIIQTTKSCFRLFGILGQNHLETRLGVLKELNTDVKIHINGQPIKSLAELASLQPVQIINPETVQLIDAGPQIRRHFLDWGLFHVEQKFYPLWKRLQRVLKQRNAALRSKLSQLEVKLWNEEFIEVSQQIAALRAAYFQTLQPKFWEILQNFIDLPHLEMMLNQGWDKKRHLIEVLEQAFIRDVTLGYTQFGPQRADIMFKINNMPASDILSRGEQKLVGLALRLAQGDLLSSLTQRHCVYLIDDLAAELDNSRHEKVWQLLHKQAGQVMLTAVSAQKLPSQFFQTAKCFEIEQGEVKLLSA